MNITSVLYLDIAEPKLKNHVASIKKTTITKLRASTSNYTNMCKTNRINRTSVRFKPKLNKIK